MMFLKASEASSLDGACTLCPVEIPVDSCSCISFKRTDGTESSVVRIVKRII